jgi:hypothetical protein
MSDHISHRANESIARREYISGLETRYYILTIKLDNQHYFVKVLDQHKEVAVSDIVGSLAPAKKEGIRLLLQRNPSVSSSEVTMVHYKNDRPSSKPWTKDSEKVVSQLMAVQGKVIAQGINESFLDDTLRKFQMYRLRNESIYLLNERNFKTEMISILGPILQRLPQQPELAIEELVEILSGQDKDRSIRSNLIKVLGGYIWLDDFLVFLRNTSTREITNFFQHLFDQGITDEVRKLMEEHYTKLFDAGKFTASKKKIETPNQLLAVLLASYSPEEYVFYRPNDFGSYVDRLGLRAPNDVVERYALYTRITHLILAYAEDKGYPVQDLIDAYHVVYLLDRYDDEAIGGIKPVMTRSNPINRILYGPPGTGKTYRTVYEALSILNPDIDQDLLTNPMRRDEAVSLFNQYVDSNQITFCTFHQSFSYEEFVEGIRFSEEKKHYEVQDGLFKTLCKAARISTSERKQAYDFDPETTQFFKMSLGNTATDDDEIYDYCISNNVIALGWGEHVDFSKCDNRSAIRKLYESQLPNENPYGAEFVERFKHWMRVGDIVIVSYGNKSARAIGKITGGYNYKANSPIRYHHFREVQWLFEDNDTMLPVQSILRDKVFSQQTVYMFANDDLNTESIQSIISGDNGLNGQERQFVMIIDEINRGNISKIFGELITLIETDKRMGQRNELSATLPYSGDRLRVPSNVHILGTMNTADRSIALLDTALRRRFEFVEMLPDYEVLPTDVEGVNIRLMLETINRRIEYLYDRDHIIGHSYFILENPQIDDYLQIIKNKVIPLLQEYFYEDWEQIELILGGAGKPGNKTYFLNKEELLADRIFVKSSVSLEANKIRYIVQSLPTKEALKRIYGFVQEDQGE